MPKTPKETFLELPNDDSLNTEMLDAKVQQAHEQLLQLKRQQDQIEKQKRELEELSRRQDQLNLGRTEMIEKFTRSMVVIERETYDAERRVEQLKAVHESFRQHLAVVESINPKSWDQEDINKELNKALSAVDDARAEYSRSRAVLNAEASEEVLDQPAEGGGFQISHSERQRHDFIYWLKSGAAFTLPLIAIGLLIVILLFILIAR